MEQPWRFLDRRTRAAHVMASALRDILGTDTEVAQLAAVADFSQRSEPPPLDPADVIRGVRDLERALTSVARRPGGSSRTTMIRACPVILWGACNNGCRACPNRHVWRGSGEAALEGAVDRARRSGRPVVFAGREPTLHPALLRLIERAAGMDRRPVAVIGNGRRFAYGAFTRAAVGAGLRGASIKVFAPSPATASAIARDSEAGTQTLAGIAALRDRGVAVEIRAPLHAANLEEYEGYAPLAGDLGVDRIRAEVALDAVGLDNMQQARLALERLRSACEDAGVWLDASPLAAGTGWFETFPVSGLPGRRNH